MSKLFESFQLGPYQLKSRVVMAPMTRGRAQANGTPNPIMAEYYAQRSSAGLLITEGTFVSAQGVGWVNAPGIYTNEHMEAWKPVTQAVHDKGGRIFVQLWHMGRVSHPDFQADNALPVGPSAIAAKGESHTPQGKKSYVTPRALDTSELAGIVKDYAEAAKLAIAAGFDGIELHGANGYLIDQFIRDGSNRRTDEYGGSIENRWRFPLEVVDAVIDAIGAERTAIRFSPTGLYNDMGDSDPVASYTYGAQELAKRKVVYIHVVEPVPGHMMANPDAPEVASHIRAAYDGVVILNGGFLRETSEEALGNERADAIAFGAVYLANPDLPERLQQNAPLNAPDFATFYTPGPKGYTDYPSLGDEQA